jgi:hypothetical protein
MARSSPSLLHLVARQVFANATANATEADAKPACGGGGLDQDATYNMGLHIGALFVILVTSTLGMNLFPGRKESDIFYRSILSDRGKTDPSVENSE